MARSYQVDGLTLSRGSAAIRDLVRDLQRDLRALGYLRAGIDGDFGSGTESAVCALQYDLTHAASYPTSRDGPPPVRISDYNRGRIAAVTGALDQNLAACLDDLMTDDKVPKLPSATDPAGENRRAVGLITGMANTAAPAPFILAMMLQESGGQHYRVPSGRDEDNFVVVGLDRNSEKEPHRITSRGYGIGQYTIFHHPPRSEEVAGFIADPMGNISKAFGELRQKFGRFVTGPDDRADDRDAEHPMLDLRECKYARSDPLFMRDCRRCAELAGKRDIEAGMPVYAGASTTYQTTQYYASASYSGVPVRADFLCDWPYAMRRYNGSGVNSYHYQARVLLNLLSRAIVPGS